MTGAIQNSGEVSVIAPGSGVPRNGTGTGTCILEYGAKKQYATSESTAPLTTPNEKKFIPKVCGKFLFYRQAVDSTVLTPISAIAA